MFRSCQFLIVAAAAFLTNSLCTRAVMIFSEYPRLWVPIIGDEVHIMIRTTLV